MGVIWGGAGLTHLSLFSGIGGIDLAAHWAGFETVAFVERDQFCQKVLAKNFPGVPIYDDVTTFDGAQYAGIDLVSGGFPCQPFSLAGKRRGKEDDRFLWPEMLRVVSEAKPTFVLGENVAGFVDMGLEQCLHDLGAIGYKGTALVFPASAVGASHIRYRCFIVATNANCPNDVKHLEDGRILSCGYDDEGFRREHRGLIGMVTGKVAHSTWQPTWQSSPRPLLVRNDDGIPNRVDRLRALGNAVVPQQVFPILKAIAECIQEAAP